MRGAWVLVMAACVACVPEHLVECADGRLCPAGTVCENEHATCVAAEQLTACAGVTDGTVCEANGVAGVCDRGTCLPGCGDGLLAAGEDCDDGNFASHDGCSSSCLRELPTWTQWQDPWRKRVAHVAGYDAVHGRVFVFGGHDGVSLIEDQWFRTQGVWTRDSSGLPPARRNAAMVYDSIRGVHVLFGGADAFSQPLGDTWEYDGTTWVERLLPASPAARSGHAMAFDPVRGRVVLFGGSDASMLLGGTWEYDGTTWLQASPTMSPPLRVGAAMAWDPVGEKVVMFGGNMFFLLGDTWEYAGDWANVASGAAGARSNAGLAHFPPLNRLVLFGGIGASGMQATFELTQTGWSALAATGPPSRGGISLSYDESAEVLVAIGGDEPSEGPSGEVWELTLDPVLGWSEQAVQTSPGARNTAIVYDDARGETIAMCGLGLGLPRDTWAFRDGQWTHRGVPAVQQRFQHSLVYDSVHQRVLAFGGGALAVISEFNELLEWNGASWRVLPVSPRPSVRSQAGLAYDSGRQRLVMFGGSSSGIRQEDTWEQHGTQWEQITTAVHPLGEESPAMTYDPVGERVVLFSRDGTTWTYVAGTWSVLETTNAPPPRQNSKLVFDPVRQRLALYGGDLFFGDLWELDGATWTATEIFGGRPAVRSSFGFTADRRARAFVMFGGSGLGTYFNDTWLLQYRSSTPDEQCGNGQDDDGDNQVDVNDPDCN